MNSLTFNGIDLSIYGLTVTNQNLDIFKQVPDAVQLTNKAYGFGDTRIPKSADIKITVTGTTRDDVKSKLDSIKSVLNERDSKHLVLDTQADRYYIARFVSLDGAFVFPMVFAGTLSFICYDPLAYSVNETSSDFSIDANPKTIIETAGGTAYIEPVFTLVADADLTGTIKVENLETLEELQWTGSLATGEDLEIDVENWIVKKTGTPDMATVSGQFPRLLQGSNQIKITAFSGSLNITYRNRYV